MSGVWAASTIAVWVFMIFVAILLIGTLRQIGLINLRLGPDQGSLLITDVGLDRGSEAPDFEAMDATSGEVVRFHDLPIVPRVLTFVSPSCMSCRAVLKGLNEVADTRKHEYEFLVVCHGASEPCTGLADVTDLRARLLIDPSGNAAAAFQVTLTPFVYLLDDGGRVRMRGVANDWRGIESLLEEEGTIQTGAWVDVDNALDPQEEADVGGRSLN